MSDDSGVRAKVLETIEEKTLRSKTELDRLVYSAAAIAQTPMALISFVGSDRQWFRTKVGIEVGDTPLTTSFCTHAIRSSESVFEVTDARFDQRFKNYPLVIGRPNIRFYAGAPLRVDGTRIGTICVLDDHPRDSFSFEQRSRLINSASQVSTLLSEPL